VRNVKDNRSLKYAKLSMCVTV